MTGCETGFGFAEHVVLLEWQCALLLQLLGCPSTLTHLHLAYTLGKIYLDLESHRLAVLRMVELQTQKTQVC